MTAIIKADENIFLALGFPPAEAEVLRLRSQMMIELRQWIENSGLTQEEIATRLQVSQARVSDLVRNKWQKFSLDILVQLAAKVGLRFHLARAA